MQEMKLLKQQFQQKDLHLSEQLAAIEAHLTLQQQRICNVEQAAARAQLDPLVLNDPWATTLNQAPMPPKLSEVAHAKVENASSFAAKSPPPIVPSSLTPIPEEALTVKAPSPCIGQLSTPIPAENEGFSSLPWAGDETQYITGEGSSTCI